MLVTVDTRSRGRRRTIKREGIAVGPIALRFVTVTVLALLTLVYLIQSTRGSAQQVEKMTLEAKKEELQSEREDIELEAVRLRALQRLKDTTGSFSLEPVTETETLSTE